ncbi:MAG: hypothetical protein NZ455_14000 [Bacteroidia bacterium]|nr:hypothetical protein [Bacteroidia bacterium]MDW8346739.1 hypothetical protein [Bacteroidia bacterium]
MKFNLILVFIISSLLLSTVACKSGANKEKSKQDTVANQVDTAKKSQPSINVEDLVDKIDKKRAEIEGLNLKPIEVNTNTLREKVKQKWSKIHYYVQDGKVVRIKTYPHANVSKRTEEFYLDNSTLILAVIEDNGDNKKGEPKEKLDKMYYYDNGKFIKEIKNNSEAEFNIKQSDAEELLIECNEYLEVFRQRKN